MRFNISKLVKFFLIVLLINIGNIREIESVEKEENSKCLKTNTELIVKLNNNLVENKIYRKGDKLTFTLYNQLIDELIGSTSEKIGNFKNATIIETEIDSLGYAYLPKTQPIFVDGFSPEEVKVKLINALKLRYKNPLIDLEIKQPTNIRVSISGEVLNPGNYIISSYEEEDLTILQQPSRTLKKLFVLSGGILNSADFENVLVYRADKCYLVNVLDLIKRKRIDFILEQDDKIVVEPTKKLRSYSPNYIKLGNSQLSTKNQIVYIYGLVENGGAINVDWFNNPTISVAIAGGIKKGGSHNVLIAYKNNSDQTYQTKSSRISLRDQSFIKGSNLPLTHKSIIVVSRSPFSSIVETLGDVTMPFFTITALENALEN